MSARRLREALAAAQWQPEPTGVPVTPRKAAANEHEYLRRFVDPVLMPLIESLLLYQPESIYEFIHDYADESKSSRFTKHPLQPGYAKKLTNRRKMVDFMSTSLGVLCLNGIHACAGFIKDVVAARIIVGSSSHFDSNQMEAVEYRANDRVMSRYKGRPRYLPAVITAIHPENDSFTVLYNDGKTEQHVHRMCLKPAPSEARDAQRDGGSNQSTNESRPRTAAEVRAAQVATPEGETRTRSIEIVILIIGVDGAGKTTLLSTLQGDLDKEHVPSAGFTSATFQTATGSATFYDLGGGPAFRDVWKEYYADAHGVMFVVDSSSEQSVHQSAVILQDTMTNARMEDKPLLVFANKRGHPSAVSEDALAQLLQLQQFPTSKVVSCVAKPSVNGNMADDHLEVGLHWLLDQVDKNYESLHARVQADLALKKQQDQQRQAEQRARARGNGAARQAVVSSGEASTGRSNKRKRKQQQ
ncbi:Adp-ribosylation factor-like protein, partial [Globisporangium splendens]